MKRIALIVLSFFYLVSSVGIGMESFYCCGKLASVQLVYGSATDTPAKTVNGKKCCNTQVRSFKLKDHQIVTNSYLVKAPLSLTLPVFYSYAIEPPVRNAARHIAYQANAPPGCRNIPSYTLYCTYRI